MFWKHPFVGAWRLGIINSLIGKLEPISYSTWKGMGNRILSLPSPVACSEEQ
jgi:hypothetical protein